MRRGGPAQPSLATSAVAVLDCTTGAVIPGDAGFFRRE
jgi:hypothetical protein